LKEDEIWAAAEDVWHQLPSCKIASGFIQAHRIAQKVINASGGNEFLGNKSFDNGIHCDVRKYFNKTTKGLSGRVKYKLIVLLVWFTSILHNTKKLIIISRVTQSTLCRNRAKTGHWI
jgi:hypothetical protein